MSAIKRLNELAEKEERQASRDLKFEYRGVEIEVDEDEWSVARAVEPEAKVVGSHPEGASSAVVARVHFAAAPVPAIASVPAAAVEEPIALIAPKPVIAVEENLPDLVGELEEEDFVAVPPDGRSPG